MKRLEVIINPGAGQDRPILGTLNRIYRDTEIQWDVSITHRAGDGYKLARRAVTDGADIVAACGGDGTVKEVAAGLRGTGIPMAIFPGGTANVMAAELGIPTDLALAAGLLLDATQQQRTLDLGKVGRQYFLLRLGIGLEARWMMRSERETKEQFGRFAYVLSGLQTLVEGSAPTRFRITVDDDTFECEGVTCAITNSGNLGLPGLSAHQSISVSDGMLDVLVVHRLDVTALLAPGSLENLVTIRQGKHISVETPDNPQPVIADGDPLGDTPVSASVEPGALHVIVPAEDIPQN